MELLGVTQIPICGRGLLATEEGGILCGGWSKGKIRQLWEGGIFLQGL